MKYLHEATDEELQADIDNKMTNQEFAEKYKQPDWCDYPDATMGMMGCWSLTDLFGLRHGIGIDYCKTCECFKDSNPETNPQQPPQQKQPSTDEPSA